MERRSIEDLNYVIRFPSAERPLLGNFKHVGKLLRSVEYSSRALISDGTYIYGIAEPPMPAFFLAADFCAQYGYISINDELICSFSDGSFGSTTHRAKLVQVEEALLESELDAETGSQLYKIVTQLVHNAQSNHFGCALVVDLNWTPVRIAGHTLDVPIDLVQPNAMALAQALSRMDGALHICRDLKLHGFACLLDGLQIANEDRSRGARFNSALRFTRAHPDLIVVVVSSDRPVSVIQEGVAISAQCDWNPISACMIEPHLLADWIALADQFPEKG